MLCPAGGSRLKCRLPSPMWPYIERRCGAMRCERGLGAARRTRRCGRCAPRRRASRSRRRAARLRAAARAAARAPRRCASDSAIVPSSISPLASPVVERRARASRAAPHRRRPMRARAARTCSAADAADRARRRRGAARDRASARDTYSADTTWSPLSRRARPSSRQRGVDTRTASHAVARARGSGNSLSTAAVMTPSVPSAPRNSCLQVVARVVLAQALELREHFAVRQHHFEAEHEIAHRAVAQHGEPAGIGRRDCRRSAPALGRPC